MLSRITRGRRIESLRPPIQKPPEPLSHPCNMEQGFCKGKDLLPRNHRQNLQRVIKTGFTHFTLALMGAKRELAQSRQERTLFFTGYRNLRFWAESFYLTLWPHEVKFKHHPGAALSRASTIMKNRSVFRRSYSFISTGTLGKKLHLRQLFHPLHPTEPDRRRPTSHEPTGQ